ncbi:hypothetical protein HRJ34_00250 [Rhizorhabdus wittichii]|uniref:DUF1515 domain-containing protein n=1 Tax=Rhizorhabdus wittichii TaxID=160791 RepID=A0A975D2N7_9SPHN|nr:hypothetical protein [Rhizorhabdus wittichii]QTH22010.1 hypothetical protein HRJ34_00250 [Rhizorhabdus wittichii]
MTENDLQIARDVGELKADMRTVKHDLANVSVKLDRITGKQDRGLGFFAGAAFIVTAFGGLLLALGKMLFGGHGA